MLLDPDCTALAGPFLVEHEPTVVAFPRFVLPLSFPIYCEHVSADETSRRSPADDFLTGVPAGKGGEQTHGHGLRSQTWAD